MSDVTPFLLRLQTMYGLPDSDDPQAFMGEYARLLKNFSTLELELGGDLVLKANRYKTWPTVGECVKACNEAREEEQGKIPRKFDEKNPEWSDARVAKADKMIVSDVGRRAADEGWILALWDFCREQQRLPRDNEVWKLKDKSRGFDDAYSECCRDAGGALGEALKALGASILSRRNQKGEMAWGVVPSLTDRSQAMSGGK